MTNDLWNAVWERVRSGRHAVIIGPGTLPPAPSDLKVVQVSCEAPGASGGALDAARRKVLQLLGEELLSSGPTPGQLEAGLRRRLLGDLPGPSLDARLVEACNRLADRTKGQAALADLYGMTGRLGDAVALLADSITLNFEKGSPLGLAVNRHALEALAHAAAQTQGPEAKPLRDAVAEVERHLIQAESVLGRVVLPGEDPGRS